MQAAMRRPPPSEKVLPPPVPRDLGRPGGRPGSGPHGGHHLRDPRARERSRVPRVDAGRHGIYDERRARIRTRLDGQPPRSLMAFPPPLWNAPPAAPRPGAAQWRTGYELAGVAHAPRPGTARVCSARDYLPAHHGTEAHDDRERRDAGGPCLDGHHSRLLVLAGHAERWGGL